MNKMRLTDNLLDLKIMFSPLAKENSEGEYVHPFLFNFISVDRYYLMIRKNRHNKYILCGKMPYKVPFQSLMDKYTDVFFASDDLEEVKSQFYILSEKLLHRFYLKVK